MRTLLISVALISCCSGLAFCPALAATQQNEIPLFTLSSSSDEAAVFDAYAGKGDLITHAVPVCCCDPEACNQDPPPPPGTPCKLGTLVCKCNAVHACVNMP